MPQQPNSGDGRPARITLSRIQRDVLLLLAGAAIGTLFGILVAYPQVMAAARENRAMIDSNQRQIELLWDAHQMTHLTPTPTGGRRK